MKSRSRVLAGVVAFVVMMSGTIAHAQGGQYKILGWNDLGMHCMDDSYAVFSILPPYNNIHAQLIDPSGNRVTNPTGITVTFEAIADPDGSINRTSAGKTNFWAHVAELFGASPAVDTGLIGTRMPGAGNVPQPMAWESSFQWFTAEGIPITAYDDSGAKNTYPLMHLVARNSSGAVLATTDIVLPISDEMNCRACHASGSGPAAEPTSGWVNDPDPVRDYRLNVLLKHDDLQLGSSGYTQALADAGYSALGLYDTVINAGTAVLCARCHGSNALPGTGFAGISMLTSAVHSRHASVIDPATGMTMDADANRTACYRCHPGSETRCLRGAMGHATASDASLSIQCQGCHGGMSMVGNPSREGWLDEPTCQSCHTGTATDNAGQIRYLTVFDAPGHTRVAPSTVFATNPDTPAPGISLFRFSTGHGGLQCESCHGSTHAIFPSSHGNDEIRNVELQGHAGTVAECSACHGNQPQTTTGGPHGMHPVGQSWIERHHDVAEHGSSACRDCHGTDYRGTVLSRALGDRTLSAFGTKSFWKGYQIGCYTCHNGPRSEDRNPNHPPTVSNLSAAIAAGAPLTLALQANDADGDSLQLRAVSQPGHGRAGVGGTTATYVPDPGFSGTDTFTYAAWDGMADSNLATVTVNVAGASCELSCSATVPATAVTGENVQFAATATPSGCSGIPSYSWSFGDSSTSTQQNPQHAYSAAGTYTWTVTTTLNGATCSRTGTIEVSDPLCDLSCSATVPAAGITGESVQFAATATPSGCSGTPTYSWSFGDGSTSSSQNPQHAYGAAGTYTWTVTATLNGATCSRTGTIEVANAGGGECVLECEAHVPETARSGRPVSFTAEVNPSDQCGGSLSYAWTFGDGGTSTRLNTRHTYRRGGTYSWTFAASISGVTCRDQGTIAVNRPRIPHEGPRPN